VLLEGILTTRHYQSMLAGLHHDPEIASHWFYLDIPFAETVRRHRTRPQSAQFTSEQMAQWYRERDLLPSVGETVIGADSTLEAGTDLIMRRSGLAQLAATNPEDDRRGSSGFLSH
jgi:hypothetical protein